MCAPPAELDWPRLVAELGERFDADCIEPSVRAHLAAAGSPHLLVACSGGADSVFLLCLLLAHRAELGLQLRVAHYNHRWRGAASDRDAAYVQGMAAALGLALDLGRRADNEAAFTETAARSLRLEFLRQAARQAGCAAIAFGHQLDDILETQLQRLARGVGSDGLAAPRPVAMFPGQPPHLRPLLNLRAGDIRMALNAVGISWREDVSNDDTRIARNALRHEVIPDLHQALDRDPAPGAARSRQLLEEDAAALDLLARERLPEAFAGAAQLPRPALCALPRALMRRALAAWLSCSGLLEGFSAAALDRLIADLRRGRERSRMSAGLQLICFDRQQLWLEAEELTTALQHVQFEPGETVILATGHVIDSELLTLDAATRQSILAGQVDPANEAVFELPGEELLDLRSWRPGDRFHPLGAPGSKKLQDWFIDRRIPRKERKLLPVVTKSSGEVIWVPGFPPAERLKIKADTKQALRLTYRLRNPP